MPEELKDDELVLDDFELLAEIAYCLQSAKARHPELQ